VSVQPRSSNSKLSPIRVELARSGRPRNVPIGPFVASTYVSIKATCPDSCVFKKNGCFAAASAGHLTMAKLDRDARHLTGDKVTRLEAEAIDRLFPRGVPQDGRRGGRDLRLHVGGEAASSKGARLLGQAAARYIDRGGGRVWTYTARWQEFRRPAWGPISVLASVQHPHEIAEACGLGYASAIVIRRFPPGGRAFRVGAWTVVPCPAETRGRTCVECRLCFDDAALLRRRQVIAFEPHGRDAEQARVRLPVIGATR